MEAPSPHAIMLKAVEFLLELALGRLLGFLITVNLQLIVSRRTISKDVHCCTRLTSRGGGFFGFYTEKGGNSDVILPLVACVVLDVKRNCQLFFSPPVFDALCSGENDEESSDS
ncbi:hypothetical protein V6N12_032734 [Hibiscus sabdariffa]